MRKLFAAAVIMAALLSSASAINIIGLPLQPVVATGSSAGTATVNADAGIVTTTALTTAAAGTATLTLNNNQITPLSVVELTLYWGTNTQGTPIITAVTTSTGSVAVTVQNQHASAALNGTLKVNFVVFN